MIAENQLPVKLCRCRNCAKLSSMGVIEHFEEGPQAALKEAYRILKPGGLAIVSVPTVNMIRRIYRRPIRNAVNSLFGSLSILVSGWSKSKSRALYAAAAHLLPERIKRIISGKENRYYHFAEYRYTRTELESFLTQAGFEIVETRPHDFYGSKNHAVGLWVDFPFLRVIRGTNFRVNILGRLISQMLDGISPWIACSSVICVGRSLKKSNPDE